MKRLGLAPVFSGKSPSGTENQLLCSRCDCKGLYSFSYLSFSLFLSVYCSLSLSLSISLSIFVCLPLPPFTLIVFLIQFNELHWHDKTLFSIAKTKLLNTEFERGIKHRQTISFLSLSLSLSFSPSLSLSLPLSLFLSVSAVEAKS